MAQKHRKSAEEAAGISATERPQPKSSGKLREELENLLLFGMEYGHGSDETKAMAARIAKRYGQPVAMLMQIAGFRGDQSRKDVKKGEGIDDEFSEYNKLCSESNKEIARGGGRKGKGK